MGKSTLVQQLAAAAAARGLAPGCLAADPGMPAFGIPGALCLGAWQGEGWWLRDFEPLCSLDAGRFRLPLLQALRRLLARAPSGPLLIDGPGVVRGVAGAELLEALVEMAAPAHLLLVQRGEGASPLDAELRALPVPVWQTRAHPLARRPGKRLRARQRTALWEVYLGSGMRQGLRFQDVTLLGTPPYREVAGAWLGRQVALLDAGGSCLALGEVVDHEPEGVALRLPRQVEGATALLTRDAKRLEDGLLGTAQPDRRVQWHGPPGDLLPPQVSIAGGGPRPVLRAGEAMLALVNGVFGDPLLHLRLRHRRRSLLFDLGEAGRLPTRIAHQVSDVFLSHAHFDHIAGFLWLLRSRLGVEEACRLYGPPGLADNIQGLISGIHWDRIGDRGPRFQVTEIHGDALQPFQLQAGREGRVAMASRSVLDGVVCGENEFQVRAVTLDHGTPVMAYAFEPACSYKVRRDRLQASGWTPGPWLTELKLRLAAGQETAEIRLPDGSVRVAETLGRQLMLIEPGKKIVYATDLADTAENRERLESLARDAHTLFCEAVFTEADRAQAQRTGHLTATACGEIARAARVERLVPFHFSKRYESDPQPLYRELVSVFPSVLLPGS